MDIEAGLKGIVEGRKLAAQPKTNGSRSWICVMGTGTEGGASTYKMFETARIAVYEQKPELATVIIEWKGNGYLLKVFRRIFRSKRVVPKRGTVRYQLDSADLAWLKGLNICDAGDRDGSSLEIEVIAFTGANTIAQLRKEGLYSP